MSICMSALHKPCSDGESENTVITVNVRAEGDDDGSHPSKMDNFTILHSTGARLAISGRTGV